MCVALPPQPYTPRVTPVRSRAQATALTVLCDMFLLLCPIAYGLNVGTNINIVSASNVGTLLEHEEREQLQHDLSGRLAQRAASGTVLGTEPAARGSGAGGGAAVSPSQTHGALPRSSPQYAADGATSEVKTPHELLKFLMNKVPWWAALWCRVGGAAAHARLERCRLRGMMFARASLASR